MKTLKEMRLDAGLRQTDVAVHLEVHRTAVMQWEHGRTVPERKYRPKLARLYGVPDGDIEALVRQTLGSRRAGCEAGEKETTPRSID